MRKYRKFCSSSQSIWEKVAQHRGRSSKIVSQKLRRLVAPPKTLSLSSGEWVPSKIHPGRERISGVATWCHRHAADREVSDPTESASTRGSAVRSSSIFLAATLCCFGRMIVLNRHKATGKKGRLSVRKTSPEDQKKPTLGKESPRFRIVWIESAGPGRFSHARF